MEFLFNDYFMWCMFVCHRVLSIFRLCFTAKLPVISFDVVVGLFFAQLTHSHRIGFLLPFSRLSIFYSFFLSCSSVFAIEYAIGSRASICLSQKGNFWAKCQLCTLNIYRIAIYVIAWFSSTNIHALENCLISGSIFPSILCIIRSYFSSIANWWFDLLCVHVHAFTIYFCTASIGVCSFIRSFWLLLLCFKSIDCSFWQSISFEFCSSQISIILPLLLPNFLIRKASHDMNFYRK